MQYIVALKFRRDKKLFQCDLQQNYRTAIVIIGNLEYSLQLWQKKKTKPSQIDRATFSIDLQISSDIL